MLYTATHNVYSNVSGHSTGETRVFGSLKAARKWARDILPATASVSDENYHRDMARMSMVSIKSNRTVRRLEETGQKVKDNAPLYPLYPYTHRPYLYREMVTPEIHVVPSVGQLGYW